VRWPDGEVRSSALHVRFGKLLAPFAKGRRVTVHINSMPCAIALELGQEGDASYRPTAAELAALGLRLGINHVEYRCDGRPVVARLYLLECHEKVIISDIDGTITRYDLLGHVPVAVARLARINQFHRGVCAFFERCASNGYHLLYLTARPAGMAARTLELLASAHEDGHRLPRGPLILSPSRTFEALDRELVRKIPHLFKISALSDIRSLWPETQNPYVGAFGNKLTDTEAYKQVGVPLDRLFCVDSVELSSSSTQKVRRNRSRRTRTFYRVSISFSLPFSLPRQANNCSVWSSFSMSMTILCTCLECVQVRLCLIFPGHTSISPWRKNEWGIGG